MSLHVDSTSPIPIYHQIREQLRKQITRGHLKPGDPLPTEMEICSECGISRMTARQALVQLANDGLVVRQRGRGTFVATPKAVLPDVQGMGMSYTAIMGQAGMSAGARILSQEVLPVPDEVAASLKINAGEKVVRIVRMRLASNEVMSLETSYYPYNRFPELANANLTNASVYQFLEDRYAITPAYATDTLEITTAGAYEAEKLEIKEGGPIALVTTVACLADDTPVAYTQTVHRGDRFRSVIRRFRQ
jgi:GntR family transcriptional regulator